MENTVMDAVWAWRESICREHCGRKCGYLCDCDDCPANGISHDLLEDLAYAVLGAIVRDPMPESHEPIRIKFSEVD